MIIFLVKLHQLVLHLVAPTKPCSRAPKSDNGGAHAIARRTQLVFPVPIKPHFVIRTFYNLLAKETRFGKCGALDVLGKYE